MRRLLAPLWLAAAVAAPACAQTGLPLGPSPIDAPQAPRDPVGPAPDATAASPPTPLSAPEPVYVRRDALACGDFRRSGGGWAATSSVQLAGPAGPVRLAAGQSFGPGEYVSGLDLAALLQRDCPDTGPGLSR